MKTKEKDGYHYVSASTQQLYTHFIISLPLAKSILYNKSKNTVFSPMRIVAGVYI